MGGGAVTAKIRPAGSSVSQTGENVAWYRSEKHCDHTAPATRLSFIVTSAKQLKEELASEPSYLDETIEIIKKHGGRIYQKELRKELMHLSESKVSLILTELEHNDRIEKIKKGRGNAIILK